MKFNTVMKLFIIFICAIQLTISLARKNSRLHLKALLARKHKKINSAILTKNYNPETERNFNDFMMETLVNFKNRNSNYESIGKASTNNAAETKSSIIYKKTKDLDYKIQFNNDIVMVYKTFYPENEYSENFFYKKEVFSVISKSIAVMNTGIVNSFKRILYAMVDNGMYYNKEENKILNIQEKKDENLWPHPLAAGICHGTRTIFLYQKSKFENEEKLPNFFFGKENNLLQSRATASHKMHYDSKTHHIKEKKILFEAGLDWGKSLIRSDFSPHYGMNIPLGGIGNLWPDHETRIDSLGFGVKGPNVKSVDKDPLQAGHLYVRMDKLEGSPYASIMLGLEEESPNYKGMFSHKVHNMLNAIQAPQTSVCGGDKWKSLGQKFFGPKIPAGLGGKVVFFETYPEMEIFNKIENFKEALAKKVWWIILSSNCEQYKLFKKNYLSILTEEELDKILKLLDIA